MCWKRRSSFTGSSSRLVALTWLLGLGLVPATAGAADPPKHEARDHSCPIADALSGVWKTEDGKEMIRFYFPGSKFMYASVERGKLQEVDPVVACAPDHVVICASGRRVRFDLELAGDRLEVRGESNGSRRSYRKEASVPLVFDPQPLALPQPQALSKARVAAIRQALASRRVQDQAVRQTYDRAKLDPKKMMRVDRENTTYLRKLVADVGWIDPQRFGSEAAESAFLLVQHSGDLPLMLAVLPHLHESGRLEDYALLFDRLRLHLGRPQRYGTQLGWDDAGKLGLLPIEDLDGVDTRRATVGLGPLDGYLAQFGLSGRRVLDCGVP